MLGWMSVLLFLLSLPLLGGWHDRFAPKGRSRGHLQEVNNYSRAFLYHLPSAVRAGLNGASCTEQQTNAV